MATTYIIRTFGSVLLLPPSIQITTPPPSGILVPSTPSFYVGTGGMLPLLFPVKPYIVNGLALDAPTICTAPITNSVVVPTGSVFSLSFTNPSAQTQTLLTTFPIATMTFALYTGEQVTAQVSIQTTTGSVLWQVLCTTLTTTQVTRWKVQSQFP